MMYCFVSMPPKTIGAVNPAFGAMSSKSASCAGCSDWSKGQARNKRQKTTVANQRLESAQCARDENHITFLTILQTMFLCRAPPDDCRSCHSSIEFCYGPG